MTDTHTQVVDDYVTISEASRIAFMSVDTLRRYADSGKLPHVRTPGNQRRFKRADVESLLKPAEVA